MFRNQTFSFETLRAAGFAVYGGADLGEVIVTAQKVRGSDIASWHRSWKATAERVHKIGSEALAAGHRVSARERFCEPRTTTGPQSSSCANTPPRILRCGCCQPRLLTFARSGEPRSGAPSRCPGQRPRKAIGQCCGCISEQLSCSVNVRAKADRKGRLNRCRGERP